MSPQPKVLLIRLDRIGDLVLSLPVDQNLPYASQWWIPPGLGFIAQAAQPPRRFSEISKTFQLTLFFKLWRELRAQTFAAAVVFHAPWWISFLLFAARIPRRVGVLSQWHSFLFFNCGIRQKRSRAECSELEYNYSLLENGLGLMPLPRNYLRLRAPTLIAKTLPTNKTYFVIHPGMGNSALNWPQHLYVQLISQLSLTSDIVITGTPADEMHLSEIRAAFASHPRVHFLIGRLSGPELLSVLQNAMGVLAPSTGVLHLAAATDTPTLGIFSPVRVQSARRWGPQGLNVSTFTPQVECPGIHNCLGPACPHFNCMNLISPTEVEARLRQMALNANH